MYKCRFIMMLLVSNYSHAGTFGKPVQLGCFQESHECVVQLDHESNQCTDNSSGGFLFKINTETGKETLKLVHQAFNNDTFLLYASDLGCTSDSHNYSRKKLVFLSIVKDSHQ